MSILFDNASSEYLTNANGVATQPLTMATWIYPDEAQLQLIMNVGNTAVQRIAEIYLEVVSTVNRFALNHKGATTSQAIRPSTPNYSLNTWHHVVGRFEIADRELYADGVSIATGSTNVGAMPVDTTMIGAEIYGGVISLYFSGRIAEPAVWDVSLSDDEIALLAKGFSPLFFRPQNLAAYWPLIALEDINDRIGGFNMTAVNTPITADHMPKIIYPAPPFISYPSAAAAVGNPWYAYAQQ